MKKYLYIIMCLALAACANNNGGEEDEEKEEAAAEMADVTLTDAQAASLKVTTGELSYRSFQGLTEANGTLAVMPQSEASVSSYIGANVKTILVKEGQKVSQGQTLAVIAHPNILELQRTYLQAYNRLTFVTQEYERQKKLHNEKIGSGKDFQQIQSEYRTLQSELSTTASQLQMLGININTLRAGKTVNTIAVTSPISGTVEKVLVKIGQYADSETPMFHIVNTDNIYADLLVFEKDVPKVRSGQKVRLSLKSTTGAERQGTVTSVGTTFENSPKAVHVRVSIDGSREGLITGMYLCGRIATTEEKHIAIPSEGVVDEQGKSYIFSAMHNKGKWVYSPIEVTKGAEENGYIQITLPSKTQCNGTFALDNAYYLLSEMKKSETGEE